VSALPERRGDAVHVSVAAPDRLGAITASIKSS